MLFSQRSINIYQIKEQQNLRNERFSLSSWVRNAVVNRISFQKRLRKGYEIGENNELLVYSDGKLIKGNEYLKPYGLRCRYISVRSGDNNRIATILIYNLEDKWINKDSSEEFEKINNEENEPKQDKGADKREKHTEDRVKQNIKKKKDTIYILFSHGNCVDIGHMFFTYARLCSFLKVNLVSYDYNGYGHSSGKATELNLYTNISSVYDYMRNSLKIDPMQIIIYGNSLGSAPSCYLVSQPELYPVGGLILHSTIASGLRVFFKSIIRHSRFDAFDNAEFLKNCPLIPVFLMHGIADKQIPIEQAVELTCIIKESHESMLSKKFNQNNKFHLEKIPNPEIMAEHTHQNQENIEIIPRGRFSQVIQDARKINQTNQYVKTWWIEGAGHNDIESSNSADYYDHLSKFIDLCRKWQKIDHCEIYSQNLI